MRILQLSTAVPKNEYSTEEMMDRFPCRLPEGVRQNILNLGISKRYLLKDALVSPKKETTLSETGLIDLCVEACEKVLENAGTTVMDIGFFIATYDLNPFLCPGLSQFLVRNIGFKPYIKHVNAQGMACTAFPMGLELAKNYLAAHPRDHVLLCVSGANSCCFQNQVHGMKEIMEIDKINRIKGKAKRLMELRKWIAVMEYFLFGDGVAAAVIANNGGGLYVKRTVEVTNFRKRDYLAGYARLAALNEPLKFGFQSHLAREIPKLGVEYTGLALKKLLGRKSEDVMSAAKKWAIHTGSEKILDQLAQHHQIQREKFKESFEVLRGCGNLSGASLPFILEKIVASGELAQGDVVLLLGFGWGFAATATLLEFNS